MTVIAAARTKTGHIVMAADRMITIGWNKGTHDVPKLWVSGDWVIGGAGDMRTLQVVKHHTTFPKYRPDEHEDWEAFCVKEVVPAIRRTVKDHGILKTENGIETIAGTMLLATADKLVEVSCNGCAYIDTTGRGAIGSGCDQAFGSLGDEGPWTEGDVITAVKRAAQTNLNVALPVDVVDTDTKTIRVAE